MNINYNKYIGHNSQLLGVEEHRLVGGKGDGMRLLLVKNGRGLEFTVSLDRCADISRLSVDGVNYGFFSPCGYVSPHYYSDKGTDWLKTFTAGFLTTCGLTAVGNPCIDEGEELPLHGRISNTPADYSSYDISDKEIIIKARINQSGIFDRKLVMNRTISCSLESNEIVITDNIINLGYEKSPIMILYHMNMGYPLLDEDSIIEIPSTKVVPRNEYAAKDLDTWDKITPPTPGFEEQCYYHSFEDEGSASIYNPKLKKGLKMTFDANKLDYFVEWKMLGERDYVLGLEPGNCHADGRDKMREEGNLKFLEPGEDITYQVKLTMISE